jgi:hypothetical protein
MFSDWLMKRRELPRSGLARGVVRGTMKPSSILGREGFKVVSFSMSRN